MRASPRVTVAERTVATRDAHTGTRRADVVTLKLAKPYSALAGARGGLSATASVSSPRPATRRLRQSVAVTFLRTERPARGASSRKPRQPPRHRSGGR